MKTLLKFAALALLLLIATGCQSLGLITPTPEPGPVCGGVAGMKCPNGYFCKYSEPWIPDEVASCRKINQSKLAACIKLRKITVTCSSEYQCARQKELLGPVFQSLYIRYDDALTDCAQYGDSCETEYHDREMLAWSSTEYGTNARGTMDMARLAFNFGCQSEIQ